MTISDTLTGEYATLPLWFSVPKSFVAIDSSEAVDDRATKLIRQSSTLPNIDPRQQLNLVFAQEKLHSQLSEAGAVYAAHCVARSEYASRIVTALFAVIVQEVPGLADQSMNVIARALTNPGQPTEVLLLDFPAGQAVVRGEQLHVEWNGHSHSMRQAQIMFRLPDKMRLAILSMSSSHLEDWEHFTGILNEIAKSVSFTEPTTATSKISATLDGGS